MRKKTHVQNRKDGYVWGKVMFDLTKKEALEAMREGKKVTREYFSSDEFIFMDDHGIIHSEDGFCFTEWWNNIEPTIGKTNEKCWRIWE